MRPGRAMCTLFLLTATFGLPFRSPPAAAQYAVGTDDITFIDSQRNDRAVPVDLYYPAVAAGAGQPVADPPAGGFGAVAFGHGFQIATGSYEWIARHLASIGCVVALPRTAGELFPDHRAFGLDLAFAARAVRDAGDDAASPFHRRMGPDTLVMGHSMGGGCSLLAAGGDPSLTAVANLAAAETDPSAVAACASIDRPVLLMSAGNDCVTPPEDHQIPMYQALAGGWRTRIELAGAGHCQFNAYSFLCSLGEFCSADIPRQEQQDRTWMLLEPWVRAVLFDDRAARSGFEALLAAGDGFSFEQAGGPSPIGPARLRTPARLEAHPNPFNPAVQLSVTIDRPGPVRLEIYDAAGRRLRILRHERWDAGEHTVRWNGRDRTGRAVPSGVYFVRLNCPQSEVVERLALVR